MRNRRIGILALQGDFALHGVSLRAAGAETVDVRVSRQLDDLDGLVIPGGESTALLKLMEGTDFFEAIRGFHDRGGALYGTCAGVILLASRVGSPAQPSIGLLDVDIQRNGYGRQVDSFETSVPVPLLGDPPLPMIFIRAPVIRSVGAGVEILAELRGRPVMVRSGRILATTFHPELTPDTRIHRLFASMCAPVGRGRCVASVGGSVLR
ncbi:MAG: pyridoxal 5'-phosphate synthase glutaminase subunit PdxT [Acidobacteria bacterium]|nr:pyridoxal 5'-phosphate synthase glutaminase subunit PdxT [Acidobacteriota bacterium]